MSFIPYLFLYLYDDYVDFKRKGMLRYPRLCLPPSYTSLQYYYYYVVFVVRRTQRDIYLRPLLQSYLYPYKHSYLYTIPEK